MKVLKKLFICLILIMISNRAISQEVNPDQNPNYEKSMRKYMLKKDSLTMAQGTTVQETYKAFDWVEWKRSQKELRRERRHELRMARASAPRYYSNPYSYPYSNYPYYPRRHHQYYNPYYYTPYAMFYSGF